MILTFSIFFGINAQAAQLYYNDAYHDYDGGEIALTINGKKLAASSLPMNPVIIDGRTMVPMRFIFEKLGAAISWEPDAKKVSAEKDGIAVKQLKAIEKIDLSSIKLPDESNEQ